jgi:hypothetical protein
MERIRVWVAQRFEDCTPEEREEERKRRTDIVTDEYRTRYEDNVRIFAVLREVYEERAGVNKHEPLGLVEQFRKIEGKTIDMRVSSIPDSQRATEWWRVVKKKNSEAWEVCSSDEYV